MRVDIGLGVDSHPIINSILIPYQCVDQHHTDLLSLYQCTGWYGDNISHTVGKVEHLVTSTDELKFLPHLLKSLVTASPSTAFWGRSPKMSRTIASMGHDQYAYKNLFTWPSSKQGWHMTRSDDVIAKCYGNYLLLHGAWMFGVSMSRGGHTASLASWLPHTLAGRREMQQYVCVYGIYEVFVTLCAFSYS